MITTVTTSRTRPSASNTASEPLTDATTAAITTPPAVPATRPNVRFKCAAIPATG